MTKKKDTGKTITDPHDKIVKMFLGENETAKSLFREYLPRKITENLDLDSLKISKDTFIDKKLSRYFSDLLYEIKLHDSTAFIYLLLEHKSYEEHFTAFQLLKYIVRIWEAYLKQHRKAKVLPVIIPMVLYHGKKDWKAETDFISLFDVSESTREYIPDFHYHLNDISHLPDEEIRGTVLLRILFTTLKYIFTPKLRHKLPGILGLLRELENKTIFTEYLEALLRYVAGAAETLTDEDLKKSMELALDQGGDIMSTIAEKWVEEGREEIRWETIKNSLKEGLSVSTIAKITRLPIDRVQEIQKKMTAG